MVCDYQYKWDATEKKHKKTVNRKVADWYPGKWRREWMPLGFLDPNNTGVNYCPLRYADVVLMYVEALVRQNRTSEAIQLADFKKIRTRAGLDAYTTSQLTIDELYAERGRELAWEGWRHEDMIRFGKYLKKYWAHPDQSSETFRNVFPIPTDILNANPKLSQNKDY